MYSRFPAVTRHFIVNESGPEIVHEGIYRLQAKLNLLHEKIFPLLPRQIDPPQVNDWTRLNFLFAWCAIFFISPVPKDQGMLWFYVKAARRPSPAARRPQWC